MLSPVLDEKRLRLFVAAEAMALGHGVIVAVFKATGISRPTITAGCKELVKAKSVDTKKEKLVGPFKNNGRELRPKGDPEAIIGVRRAVEKSGCQ